MFSGDSQVIATGTRPIDAYSDIRKARLSFACQNSEYVQLDLTNMEQVEGLLNTFQPTAWIHHAGYAEGYQSESYNLRRSLDLNLHVLDDLYKLFKKYW